MWTTNWRANSLDSRTLATLEESVRMTEDRDKQSTSMAWPTLGSRTAKEQNRINILRQLCFSAKTLCRVVNLMPMMVIMQLKQVVLIPT